MKVKNLYLESLRPCRRCGYGYLEEAMVLPYNSDDPDDLLCPECAGILEARAEAAYDSKVEEGGDTK